MPGRRKEVQALLSEAQKLVDRATEICKVDGLDGVSFMGKTFRCYRRSYDGTDRHITEPDWYDNEYWNSSSAGCEVGMIWDEEED